MGEPADVAPPAPVTVVGLAGEGFDLLEPAARRALAQAQVVVGGRRLLGAWEQWHAPGPGPAPETIEIGGDATAVARAVAAAVARGARVCVLASGDPGFFGILRALLHAVDRRSLCVLPAVSSLSLAFARLGLPWDDATVVSAHGRPLADALAVARDARKCAVLTSPGSPPEAVGAALLGAGAAMDLVAVCTNLGTPAETVTELSLKELATRRFDPLSVVVLVRAGALPLGGARPTGKVLAWGLPEDRYATRGTMITKAEVRAVVLAKLALPRSGVLWDVGAGSGSVAVEAAALCPDLTVLAVEQRADTARRIATNAGALGVTVDVVTGRAPGALDSLATPDRAFVGGGGLEVLDAVRDKLAPGGRVVAAFAAMERAAAAAERLGNLVQVTVARGERLPSSGWRLEGQNPVFVVWGPA